MYHSNGRCPECFEALDQRNRATLEISTGSSNRTSREIASPSATVPVNTASTHSDCDVEISEPPLFHADISDNHVALIDSATSTLFNTQSPSAVHENVSVPALSISIPSSAHSERAISAATPCASHQNHSNSDAVAVDEISDHGVTSNFHSISPEQSQDPRGFVDQDVFRAHSPGCNQRMPSPGSVSDDGVTSNVHSISPEQMLADQVMIRPHSPDLGQKMPSPGAVSIDGSTSAEDSLDIQSDGVLDFVPPPEALSQPVDQEDVEMEIDPITASQQSTFSDDGDAGALHGPSHFGNNNDVDMDSVSNTQDSALQGDDTAVRDCDATTFSIDNDHAHDQAIGSGTHSQYIGSFVSSHDDITQFDISDDFSWRPPSKRRKLNPDPNNVPVCTLPNISGSMQSRDDTDVDLTQSSIRPISMPSIHAQQPLHGAPMETLPPFVDVPSSLDASSTAIPSMHARPPMVAAPINTMPQIPDMQSSAGLISNSAMLAQPSLVAGPMNAMPQIPVQALTPISNNVLPIIPLPPNYVPESPINVLERFSNRTANQSSSSISAAVQYTASSSSSALSSASTIVSDANSTQPTQQTQYREWVLPHCDIKGVSEVRTGSMLHID